MITVQCYGFGNFTVNGGLSAFTGIENLVLGLLYVCCISFLFFESLVLLRDAAHEDLIEYPSNEGGNAVL